MKCLLQSHEKIWSIANIDNWHVKKASANVSYCSSVSKIWTSMTQDLFVLSFNSSMRSEKILDVTECFLKIVGSQGFLDDSSYFGVPTRELLIYFGIRKHLIKQLCCMIADLECKIMLSTIFDQKGCFNHTLWCSTPLKGSKGLHWWSCSCDFFLMFSLHVRCYAILPTMCDIEIGNVGYALCVAVNWVTTKIIFIVSIVLITP